MTLAHAYAHPVPNGARETLLSDHERLERLLRSLLIRASEGDARDLTDHWRAFEEGLRAHLTAEEEELFPTYAKVNPDEVRALRREHAEIRSLLDAAGLGVELHTARLLMLEDLAARLREHAHREDTGVYSFVDDAAPMLFRQVKARLQAAVRDAGA